MPIVRRPFVLGLYGTSLTQGRLNADWPARLLRDLKQYPEAKGPILIFNEGRGSQNSDWGLINIAKVADQRPTHVLMEPFSINDSIDVAGSPAVSLANHDANVTAMVAALRAARADVDITLQTMNSVGAAGAALRPLLAAFYARDVALAGTLGLRLINNYDGQAGGPVGGWPKPLPPALSAGAVPFTLPVTPGFVGFDNTVTWNPADKQAGITLGPDNNLIATGGNASGIVRATSALIAPQMHFEHVMGAGDITRPGIGVATAAANLNNYLGADAAGIGLYPNGEILRNGAAVANAGFGYAPGDRIGVEIDDTADLIYFLKNGLRTGGTSTAALTAGALYPAASFGNNVNGAKWTSQFTVDGDGLHPTAEATGIYLEPNVTIWARARMAAHWPG